MSGKPAKKPYLDMTPDELARETARFESPDYEPANDPQTPAERARINRVLAGLRAKRKAGRPRVGEGAAKVMIAVERGLLKRVDAYARRSKTSRSALIARGLRMVLDDRAKRAS